jgi:lysophospholipase L1-like esterase
MYLSLDTIREITRGCARVEEHDGTFMLMRFTEKQARAYLDVIGNEDFYNKTFATAGVRLAFRTNSTQFAFDYRFYGGSSRKFGYFDVYINGAMTSHFGSIGQENLSGHSTIALPDGANTVEIHFPWSRRTDIGNVEIDDGATVESVHRAHTMICFGDSITHGYDAIHPSFSYATRLAALLDADYINKGIGGDIFCPALLEEAECADPDYITIAYGANDWQKSTPSELEANARAFFARIREIYPTSEIFVQLPIWHGYYHKTSKLGMTVPEMNAFLRGILKDYPTLHVIDGPSLVPHVLEFYTDGAHPTEACFAFYASNFYAAIQKELK